MKKRHYLTEDDIEKIRDLIENEKLQQRKVAEIIGVHKGTIEKVCRNLQLKTQRTGPRDGEGSPLWKGGRILVGGYWYIYSPDHPYATKQRRVAEHRLVMEKKLCRYLEPHEVVHHIDGNSQNNNPDNLIVFQQNSDHLRSELMGKVPKWTPDGLDRMRKGILRSAMIRRKTKPDDGPQLQNTDHHAL